MRHFFTHHTHLTKEIIWGLNNYQGQTSHLHLLPVPNLLPANTAIFFFFFLFPVQFHCSLALLCVRSCCNCHVSSSDMRVRRFDSYVNDNRKTNIQCEKYESHTFLRSQRLSVQHKCHLWSSGKWRWLAVPVRLPFSFAIMRAKRDTNR